MPGSVIEVTEALPVSATLEKLEAHSLAVCFFWATFHEPSNRGGQMDRVFSLLAKSFPTVTFLKVEADKHEDVAEQYQVHVIPTFVFLTKNGAGGVEVLDRVTGASPRDLKVKIKAMVEQLQQRRGSATGTLSGGTTGGAAAPAASAVAGVSNVASALRSISSLVNAAHVVLIMDGIPEAPRSDASAKAVALLKECQFKFGHYDIQGDSDGHVKLALEQIHRSQKDANAADADAVGDVGVGVPQLFVGGKPIGNHERMQALHAKQALAKLKPVEAPAADLNTYLGQLIARDDVMLFMKGTPQEPRCGFSRKMVKLLEDHNISKFGSFNILTDDAVRQGLKAYSNWPTYPQLYVKGKLVGGLDIVQEMADDEDDLREALGLPPALSTDDRIRELIKAPVILFMKGSPSEPRCGFSRKAVALLHECGFKFEHFDILLDNDIRQGLKTFSNWPTFPQLYIKGKLVGGLDIMQELHEDDELRDMKP